MPDRRVDLVETLNSLRPKDKAPFSASVLDKWIAFVEADVNRSQKGRIAWIIATTAATAILQQVINEDGTSRFLLKGGTLLQYRLGLTSRATKDLDGIVSGDMDDFIEHMDEALKQTWGPISFKRTEIRVIDMPSVLIKPRTFDLILSIKGRTWRRITVDISPAEGCSAFLCEPIAPPSLAGFGLPTPDQLVGMAMSYQIAQKIHAASSPHDPPEYKNERARDVVDLVLLKELVQVTGSPHKEEIASAIKDIFEVRSADAEALGRMIRLAPEKLKAHPHWKEDYEFAANSAELSLSADEAVAQINEWISSITGECII